MVDVLVVAATDGEVAWLRDHLGLSAEPAGRRVEKWRPRRWNPLVGRIGEVTVAAVVTGVGKVNAAMAAAAALGSLAPGLVLVTGVGGAYPGSALRPGELAVATEEIYGDEGAETAQGFLGLAEMGIPLWQEGVSRCFNRFPAEAEATRILAAVSGAVRGSFVTVSTVTGTGRRARELETRWGGMCENMEGAAVAHAAAVFGVPFAEIRGIANPVGPRDRASWKLDEAAVAAQEAVAAFLPRCAGCAGRRLVPPSGVDT